MIRFSVATALLAGLSGCCVAAEPPPTGAHLAVVPERTGYAFDRPEIALRQHAFGLAHGVHLLVSACLGRADHAATTQAAYDTWHARQRVTLEHLGRELARYYFGKRAAEAQWQDIANALGLKETIYPSLGRTALDDACATLPQALAQDRYDLAARIAVPYAGHSIPPSSTPATPIP
jgi:hypothetical protein